MYRQIQTALDEWMHRSRRKPLILRGARQVGKTTLVRLFARERFEDLLEINFERDPHVGEFFASKDPRKILQLLEIHFERDVVPDRSLLFLDEIQAAPEVLAALRYFHEELPELHVIAAGSLLEIFLDAPSFSMPVGRIEYLHLGPMQFEEYLLAAGRSRLVEFLRDYSLGDEIPQVLHEELLRHVRVFLIVGGMPEAIRGFLEAGSHRESEAVKQSVLATFRDDFGKYGDVGANGRADTGRLRKVFERLPALVGDKLKWVHVDRHERAAGLAAALHLLVLARVAHRVHHTSANGVPLGAEVDERLFKVLFLDVGLMSTALGLTLLDLENVEDLLMVHQGSLCEQFAGQHLLYSQPPWEEPRLHYWVREKRGSAAEVDYVISQGQEILPVEVKAGKTGTLKSLHLFLREKKRRYALRLSSAPPSLFDGETTLPTGEKVPLRLLSLPLYLVSQARRLCGELMEG